MKFIRPPFSIRMFSNLVGPFMTREQDVDQDLLIRSHLPRCMAHKVCKCLEVV